MKVCHVTSAHNSDDVRIFRKECSSLASNGYDTYLVAKGDSREENGVHVVGVGPAPVARLKRMLFFAKTVYKKALEIDADIYHLHDPELLPYGLKLKKHGKKVIFDSHENYTAQILEKPYLPLFIRKIVSLLYRSYETHAVNKFDAVIVPCTFDGKNIFENRAKKIRYIANYPKLSDFYEKNSIKEKSSDKVCYVGGLSYARGILHLIKAAYRAEKRLVLAGPFSDEAFEKEVRAMPEFSNVDYLGVIPNSEVHRVLEQCSIGANTILNVGQYHHIDTFGVKVFEYMSIGLPVLLPDYPYMRRMAEKYNFGICVKTDDTNCIADAITYLSNNPEIAKEMGENGRKAVELEFNWSTQEAKLIELYKNL